MGGKIKDVMTFSEVYTTAVVCTSHTPRALAERFNLGEPMRFIWEPLDYGWRVYTDQHPMLWPAGIRKIMKRAKELGHRWVDFDPDGVEVADYPTYEW